jgi:hypothetical protein
MYFGLIAEFLGANSHGSEHGASSMSSKAPSPTEILDTIYNTLLLKEGETTFVVLENAGFVKLVNMARSNLPQGVEAQRTWYIHLNQCLMHAHSIFNTIPKEINHNVRSSIAALGEMFTFHIMNGLQILNGPPSTMGSWSKGYFSHQMKLSMMKRGWCSSDIARCEGKLVSLQSLNIVQMMDKSTSPRDHTECTEYSCNSNQIDLANYHVGHRVDNCQCGDELIVDSNELTRILLEGDKIPLLRLVGGLQDMRVELVESTRNSKYVAISHVWADGLGNPYTNSLHRCKLLALRELVAEVAKESNPEQDSGNTEVPLIWLDTLCCPAKDGDGKKKGIEKIYNVYQRAEHVLVLDSGLMSYAVQHQDISEQAVRIFTSNWVRRLWTLQEGALANSLYFQFADRAVSALELYSAFPAVMVVSLQHQALCMDFAQEFWNLRDFFHGPNSRPGNNNSSRQLGNLDRSLQFRGVSVPTDEPLCIGALMSLDLAAIVNVEPKEDRMQMVWQLLANCMGGLPAQIIFFEEHKINAAGWRWAPRSLLQVEKGIFPPETRVIRWVETQLGKPTPRGLRVSYSGYRITIQQYDDRRPRNPWPGFPRISEAYMHFKDVQTGQWYYVGDKIYTLMTQNWTDDEQGREYNKRGLFPLHDLADTGDSLIICNSTSIDAIFTSPNTSSFSEPIEADGLYVTAKRQIIMKPLDEDDGYISNTICKLALRLRNDIMTDTHIGTFKRLDRESGGSSVILDQKMSEDEEFKASLEALKQKMKDMIVEVIAEDERFVRAVKTCLRESFLEYVWVLIRNYFRHGYVGTKLGPEQVWFVD